MIRQQKGLLFPAARRWGLGPSRGNDASGRNDRVLLEVGRPMRLGHPSSCQAAMCHMHPLSLETATLSAMSGETR
jgi:hypothetical protein